MVATELSHNHELDGCGAAPGIARATATHRGRDHTHPRTVRDIDCGAAASASQTASRSRQQPNSQHCQRARSLTPAPVLATIPSSPRESRRPQMDAMARRLSITPLPELSAPLPARLPPLALPLHSPIDAERHSSSTTMGAAPAASPSYVAPAECPSPRTPRTGVAIPAEHRFAPLRPAGKQAAPRPPALQVQTRASKIKAPLRKRCLFGAPSPRSRIGAFFLQRVSRWRCGPCKTARSVLSSSLRESAGVSQRCAARSAGSTQACAARCSQADTPDTPDIPDIPELCWATRACSPASPPAAMPSPGRPETLAAPPVLLQLRFWPA